MRESSPVSAAWGEGARPEPVSGVRATDGDRERIIARLRAGVAEGCIDLDELEQRITSAYEVRTVAELEHLTADLPVSVTKPAAAPPPHRRPLVLEDDEFRGHLTTYCMVIGMLVVIWLLAGAHHPWPIYPAMAWGIGLASHHQVASAHQRKRLARATAEGITLAQLDAREAEEKRQHRRARRARVHEHVTARHQERRQLREQRDQGRRQGQLPAPAEPATTRFVVAMFVDVVGSTALAEALRRDLRRLVPEGHWLDDMLAANEIAALVARGEWDRALLTSEQISGDLGFTDLELALVDVARGDAEAVARRLHRVKGLDRLDQVQFHVGVSTCRGAAALMHGRPRAALDIAAATAAVAILHRLERQRTDTGFAPSVRVGIHSGDAVEDGDDIIGTVVNIASRVTDAAAADEILVTEHVADHLDDRHVTEGRGLHTLKGVARPRHLLALIWR